LFLLHHLHAVHLSLASYVHRISNRAITGTVTGVEDGTAERAVAPSPVEKTGKIIRVNYMLNSGILLLFYTYIFVQNVLSPKVV